MKADLATEFRWYLEHQDELVKKHNGKVLVIKGLQVIGMHATETEAVRLTAREHAMGTFIVQKCEPGADAYTVTYHSRVAFA